MKVPWYVCLVALHVWIACPTALGITFDFVVNGTSEKGPFLQGHTREPASPEKSSRLAQSRQLETAPLPQVGNNDTEPTSGVREKRQGESRTFNFGGDQPFGPGGPGGGGPFCFEREVRGTCRYRSSPEECFQYHWTAEATVVNIGYKVVTSIPEGLVVHPGSHPRVRVFLKTSCCNPVVQFVASDGFLQSSPCVVDVRELQDLHPGEIVGISLGALVLVILVIVIIVFCLRRQRFKKREKETVIFGRSLTRSKSQSIGNHQHRSS